MVVVELQVVEQGRLQIGPAIETRLLQQFADAAVEALHHAVGLGMARRSQAVLDAHAGADLVEGAPAAGLLVLRREAVGELRAVVGQDLGDLDRRGQLETAQEVDAAVLGHVAVDLQEHPARGAVDGHKQVAARGLVGHLRQVLDVDRQEARLVVLEGLLGRDRFTLGLGGG